MEVIVSSDAKQVNVYQRVTCNNGWLMMVNNGFPIKIVVPRQI